MKPDFSSEIKAVVVFCSVFDHMILFMRFVEIDNNQITAITPCFALSYLYSQKKKSYYSADGNQNPN